MTVALLDTGTGVLHRPGPANLTPACRADPLPMCTVGPLDALQARAAAMCRNCWGGPVGQLLVNRVEVQQLHIAVRLLAGVSAGMVEAAETEGVGPLIEQQIAAAFGAGGVARLDQTVAAARERLPVLMSLMTALDELLTGLDRQAGDD